ncbi:CLUMA_CG001239, isoform A [Clunio marinus]|uniref:CLUMA_CG001239, isoform A n=1 Tax=Clunio marinus TaxID=568069 RepID=A0A1J1HLU7_9DIPT|nr:CLUMA_CG001239, isoform A [Clunio marinus]
MEQINILDFDTPILEMILSNVHKRKSAAETCRTFYEVVCRIEKFKHRLVINKININQSMESMKNSSRYFNELCLHDLPLSHHMNEVMSVLSELGGTITRAEVTRVRGMECQLMELLNLLPNLEELHLNYFFKDKESENFKTVLHLKKLKTFKLSSWHEIRNIMDQLLSGVLEDVTIEISRQEHQDLSKFYENQINVKKLEISSSSHLRWINHMTLDEFTFNEVFGEDLLNNEEIIDFLRTQTRLVKLDLRCEINDPKVKFICTSLASLQSLNIKLYEITPEILENLNNLKYLNDLSFGVFEMDVNVFTMGRFLNITKLGIRQQQSTIIDVENLLAMEKAFPSLQEISLEGLVPVNIFIILNIFERLTVIAIKFSHEHNEDFFDHSHIKSTYSNINKLRLNLEGRNIINETNIENFLSFIYSMPKLESLELADIEVNETTARMLENLPLLKSFKISKMTLPLNFEFDNRFSCILRTLSEIKTLHLHFWATDIEFDRFHDDMQRTINDQLEKLKIKIDRCTYSGSVNFKILN